MSLPNISIPFELPIDFQVLMHPPVVHFVIALPVIIILLEIINLAFKRRSISLLSLFLIVLLALFATVAYFTGSVDGKETFMFLSDEGKEELKEHKLLGIYLVYGSWALVVFKLIFMAISRMVAKLFFVLILLGFAAATMFQGKHGGELVYKYGANNQAVSDLSDEKDELQEEYDELEGELNELKKSANEAPAAVESNTSAELEALQAKYDELAKVHAESEKAKTELQTKVDEMAKAAETKVEEVKAAVVEAVTPAVTEAAAPAANAVNLEIPSDNNGSN